MVFKRVYNGTDKKKLRKIMKVVVLQSFVGKGFLGYHVQSKNIIRDNQLLIIKCMKSVKNWCNKNGYEYILNTKDLGWNYFNPVWEKIGFAPSPDRESDFCSQRYQLFQDIDADYIVSLDNDIWIYKDFDLHKIEYIGIVPNTGSLRLKNRLWKGADHLQYIRRTYFEDIPYPQGGVQFITKKGKDHYGKWVTDSIKSNNWPTMWDSGDQSHVYAYIKQFPERIKWIDPTYNTIIGRYLSRSYDDIRKAYIIHHAGSNKQISVDKLPPNMKEKFEKL